MLNCTIAFFLSVFINILVLYLLKDKFIDSIHGVQKFHNSYVPRAGGIGIYLSLLFLSLIERMNPQMILVLVASPIFIIGLLEDLMKKISANLRLVISLLTSLVAVIVLRLDEIFYGIIPKNIILEFIMVLIITIFISGVSNAFNIIDGFNGLVAGVSLITLVILLYVSHEVNYGFVYHMSLMMIGAVMGFFVLNFPSGKIFLGDGGAYFLGFSLVILSLLLVKDYSKVSIFFPIALFVYPCYEVLFSIYRKWYLRKRSPLKPDGLHFHMLVYNSLRILSLRSKNLRNPLTSAFIFLFILPFYLVTMLFWYNGTILIVNTLVFMFVYSIAYWRMIAIFNKGFKH